MPTLQIIHEDAHTLAVNKPCGLPTQPARPGAVGPNLEVLVRRHLRPHDPASVYLGTVHRLDRPVSGIVLWAKTPRAARRLASQFEARSASKEYWALVEGPMIPGRGVWDDHLVPVGPDGVARLAGEDDPRARRAVTRFEVDDEAGGPSPPAGLVRLRLRPETGRTHQLRAQAAGRGRPIAGDRAYGSSVGWPDPAGIALHARGLLVEHPAERRPLRLVAPWPAAWDLAAAGPIRGC